MRRQVWPQGQRRAVGWGPHGHHEMGSQRLETLRLDLGHLAWVCIFLVSSLLGIRSGCLHPLSHAKQKNVHPSCIISWCPQDEVASQGILRFIHMQDASLHLASSLGVFGVGHPLRATSSFFTCQKSHTVLRCLMVLSAPGWLPRSSSSFFMCKKPSLHLASSLGVLSTLLEHLHAP